MLYYLRKLPPPESEGRQCEELSRLVQHGGWLTVHAVRVGSNTGLYLDIPDKVASLAELRVLPGLVGMEGCLERRGAWATRPEWTLHALLRPTRDARPLDVALLEGCASACFSLRWSSGGVVGHLFASANDQGLLERVRAEGWTTRLVPSGAGGRLLQAFHRPRRTALRPLLALHPPSHTTSADTPVLHAPPALVRPPFLAAAGEMGLPLGSDRSGAVVALAFAPQVLAVDAPEAEVGSLSAALLERAFALGAALVAVVPRALAAALMAAPSGGRLRLLDGGDPYSSAAIPWQQLAPTALEAALEAAGIPTGPSPQQGQTLALLLAARGAGQRATPAVRSLTAPPGDDLRGVIDAGGGVVLATDGEADQQLLAALLLASLADETPPPRPLLLLRPPTVSIPPALAARSLQVVTRPTTCHSTLVHGSGGWTLLAADGEWRCALGHDLALAPPPLDPERQAALLEGLGEVDNIPFALLDTPTADGASWWNQTPTRQEDTPEAASDPALFSWSTLQAALDTALAPEPPTLLDELRAALDVTPKQDNGMATEHDDLDPAATTAHLSRTPTRLHLSSRRRAVWRPQRSDGGVEHPQPSIVPGEVTTTWPDEMPISPLDALMEMVDTAPPSVQPPPDMPQPSAIPPVDLAPIAGQLLASWAEGTRLPALVALAAPHYPGVPPHLLRAAIRSLLAAPPAIAPAPIYLAEDTQPVAMHPPIAAQQPDTGDPPRDEPRSQQPDIDPDSYLLPMEAAQALGVTTKTIQRWSNDGKIAVVRNGANQRRIPRSEIERLRTEARGER